MGLTCTTLIVERVDQANALRKPACMARRCGLEAIWQCDACFKVARYSRLRVSKLAQCRADLQYQV